MINNNKQFCFGTDMGFEVNPTHQPTRFVAWIYSYVEVTINQIKCGHCVGLLGVKKREEITTS